jgi:uncharacterized membrane protein
MQASPVSEVKAESGNLQILQLRWSEPWQWLLLGLRDVRRAPMIALFYGLCFWGMARLMAWVFRSSPGICDVHGQRLSAGRTLPGHGPVLRQQAAGAGQARAAVGVADLLGPTSGQHGHAGHGADGAGDALGRAAMVVSAISFDTGMPSTATLLQTLLRPENWEFLLGYTAVGGIFAALVFASMVVSLPAILDLDTDALTACITSMRVVGANTGVMLLWGLIITVLIAASLLFYSVGLIVIGPLLGCASWHAYKASVRAESKEAAA